MQQSPSRKIGQRGIRPATRDEGLEAMGYKDQGVPPVSYCLSPLAYNL
jgi:hypothetical protein